MPIVLTRKDRTLSRLHGCHVEVSPMRKNVDPSFGLVLLQTRLSLVLVGCLLLAFGGSAGVSADDLRVASGPASALPGASQSQPTTEATASVSVAGGVTLSGKQAGWKGIYPGRSTQVDVVRALGEPASTAKTRDGLVRLVFGPDADLKFNSVYLDSQGIVKKIDWNRFAKGDVVRYSQLVRSFSEPRQITRPGQSLQGQTCQFPDEVGLWGLLNIKQDSVVSLVFYDPKKKLELKPPADTPMR